MVIPNFFITFVRHSFHTSHSLHIPSRERRHRPAPPCHQAPHSPHGTRTASRIKRTRLPHTLHLARAMPHAPRTRYASSPSQHTRPSALPPSQRAMPHALPPNMKATLLHAPTPRKFSEKKARVPITTKILHITILHVTFTRIGVKTTQKSEAIFSFID